MAPEPQFAHACSTATATRRSTFFVEVADCFSSPFSTSPPPPNQRGVPTICYCFPGIGSKVINYSLLCSHTTMGWGRWGGGSMLFHRVASQLKYLRPWRLGKFHQATSQRYYYREADAPEMKTFLKSSNYQETFHFFPSLFLLLWKRFEELWDFCALGTRRTKQITFSSIFLFPSFK